MKSECPMGHTENLSFEELFERLKDSDFECRVESCSKEVSYEVDSHFWEKYNGRVSKVRPTPDWREV